MKIRLKQLAAGPGGVYGAGSILEVETATAKHLIETRQAVEVEEEQVSAAPERKKKATKDKAEEEDD